MYHFYKKVSAKAFAYSFIRNTFYPKPLLSLFLKEVIIFFFFLRNLVTFEWVIFLKKNRRETVKCLCFFFYFYFFPSNALLLFLLTSKSVGEQADDFSVLNHETFAWRGKWKWKASFGGIFRTNLYGSF